MAKPLVFDFGGDEIALQMSKVDRTRLYGYKELLVLDEDERVCDLATLAPDGRTVAGRGGIGMGYWTVDGEWVDKGELKPVDLDGRKIDPVPSSFSAPVPLETRATLEELLDHSIRAVYVMEPPEDAPVTRLWEELSEGAIFKFDYSFRGGLEPDTGFLLQGATGDVFFLVGNPAQLEFLGLQQSAGRPEEEDEAEAADEGDLMDFGMM